MFMPKGDPTLPSGYCCPLSEKLGVRPVVPVIMSGKSPGPGTKSGSTGISPFESEGEKPLMDGLKDWWLLLVGSPVKPCVKAFVVGEVLFDKGERGAGRFSGIHGWGFGSSGSLLFFLFLLEWDSFSALSRTTLAIRSNSEHIPNIRLTPLFSSSVLSKERKLTTWFISRTSDLARAS